MKIKSSLFVWRQLAVASFLLFTFVIASSGQDKGILIANDLAKWGIINDQQTNPAAYHLDKPILRQEVMKIALGLKGVKLTDTYVCKGYFEDATYSPSDTRAWICQAAELAADRGIIARNPTTRPGDRISRAEALKIIWNASGYTLANTAPEVRYFVDSTGKPATDWQETLLREAEKIGVISVEKVGSLEVPEWLWKHDKEATRGEVFEIIWTMRKLTRAIEQIPYLALSGEITLRPTDTRILSHDQKLITAMKLGESADVVRRLSPTPIATRTQGQTYFLMQPVGSTWGHVSFSSITTIDGVIYQQFANYDPYPAAMKAVLREYKLANEEAFWDLEYSTLWEQTRDYVDQFYLDKFQKSKIVYPEGSTIIP